MWCCCTLLCCVFIVLVCSGVVWVICFGGFLLFVMGVCGLGFGFGFGGCVWVCNRLWLGLVVLCMFVLLCMIWFGGVAYWFGCVGCGVCLCGGWVCCMVGDVCLSDVRMSIYYKVVGFWCVGFVWVGCVWCYLVCLMGLVCSFNCLCAFVVITRLFAVLWFCGFGWFLGLVGFGVAFVVVFCGFCVSVGWWV